MSERKEPTLGIDDQENREPVQADANSPQEQEGEPPEQQKTQSSGATDAPESIPEGDPQSEPGKEGGSQEGGEKSGDEAIKPKPEVIYSEPVENKENVAGIDPVGQVTGKFKKSAIRFIEAVGLTGTMWIFLGIVIVAAVAPALLLKPGGSVAYYTGAQVKPSPRMPGVLLAESNPIAEYGIRFCKGKGKEIYSALGETVRGARLIQFKALKRSADGVWIGAIWVDGDRLGRILVDKRLANPESKGPC